MPLHEPARQPRRDLRSAHRRRVLREAGGPRAHGADVAQAWAISALITRPRCGSSPRDLDEGLAEVAALQHPGEDLGGLVEALGDVLAVLHLALTHPAGHVAQEVVVHRGNELT